MELHHLRTFREVVRERSFTAAARKLYLTQPAVSQQIKALETEIGERLLERTGRDVRPTDAGALLLRPGLIYGDQSGGMFGRLVAQVRGARFQPLIGGGRQILNLMHEQDLTDFIRRHAACEVATPTHPLTAAHEQGWAFRAILEAIASALGRRIRFIPLQWRSIWLGLKCAELVGLRLGFRSDSLLSLMNQDPHPDFSANASSGLTCRPFDAATLRL